MAVSAVGNATTSVVGGQERNPAEMSEIDFMNLLVAQIQNQDPLSPMDNAEFTGQITQFTMLDELSSLRAKMEEQLLMAQSINNTTMLQLVGRDVTVAGAEVQAAGGEVTGSGLFATAPGEARIEVKDSAGNVVATYTRDVDQGLNDIDWDGQTADGEAAADGEYTIEVTVTDPDGNPVDATVLMTAPVGGLRYENNIPVVSVFGQEFYVSDIYQVS